MILQYFILNRIILQIYVDGSLLYSTGNSNNIFNKIRGKTLFFSYLMA